MPVIPRLGRVVVGWLLHRASLKPSLTRTIDIFHVNKTVYTYLRLRRALRAGGFTAKGPAHEASWERH